MQSKITKEIEAVNKELKELAWEARVCRAILDIREPLQAVPNLMESQLRLRNMMQAPPYYHGSYPYQPSAFAGDAGLGLGLGGYGL